MHRFNPAGATSRRALVLAALVAVFGAGACHKNTTPAPAQPQAGQPGYFESTSPTATASDQVALGQRLFGQYCATCHGADGQGAKGPALVGASALPANPPPTAKMRTQRFHTAADVLDFMKKSMPMNAPGSLSEEQYSAILAFDLHANGVDTAGKKIDRSVANSIVLHP